VPRCALCTGLTGPEDWESGQLVAPHDSESGLARRSVHSSDSESESESGLAPSAHWHRLGALGHSGWQSADCPQQAEAQPSGWQPRQSTDCPQLNGRCTLHWSSVFSPLAGSDTPLPVGTPQVVTTGPDRSGHALLLGPVGNGLSTILLSLRLIIMMVTMPSLRAFTL
jgi:hypothetical protein